jgi:hypothetical protein
MAPRPHPGHPSGLHTGRPFTHDNDDGPRDLALSRPTSFIPVGIPVTGAGTGAGFLTRTHTRTLSARMPIVLPHCGTPSSSHHVYYVHI